MKLTHRLQVSALTTRVGSGVGLAVVGGRRLVATRDRPGSDAYDNALMATINGLYKTECIRTTVFHDRPYKTLADAVTHAIVDAAQSGSRVSVREIPASRQ